MCQLSLKVVDMFVWPKWVAKIECKQTQTYWALGYVCGRGSVIFYVVFE